MAEPFVLNYSMKKLSRSYACAVRYGLSPEEIVDLYARDSRMMGFDFESDLQLQKLKFARNVLNVVM